MKLYEEFKLYESMWDDDEPESANDNRAANTGLKKIALYKTVDIRPEQGPRQHYKEEIKIPTSWSGLQKVLEGELLDLKTEIIEYGNVGSIYDESTYDLTDPDEVDEYEDVKKNLDDYFSVNWAKIKKAVNNAKPGTRIAVIKIDYDDFEVSWEGTIKYNIVIL